MKTLLIDDLRNIQASHVARTFDAGIEALQADMWDVLYLDHDFGDPDPHKTGYGVICWLEEHPERLPGEIVLVTSNPVGRKQMETVIQKLYQHCPACGYETLVPLYGCRVCRTCAYSSG